MVMYVMLKNTVLYFYTYHYLFISSSRFTDSKKYEDDFVDCFNLKERRSGEICNACVLLVKRWKKLPKGTDRNWHHVSNIIYSLHSMLLKCTKLK